MGDGLMVYGLMVYGLMVYGPGAMVTGRWPSDYSLQSTVGGGVRPRF
jgi:hypothetical protein